MDDPKHPSPKARIEEALHPEIGNGAGLVNGSHDAQLRAVDPLKSLDQKLLDEAQTNSVASQWQADLNGNDPESEKITADPVVEETQVSEIESENPAPTSNNETQATLPTESKKGKDKVGKRVRKVARKEAEKTDQSNQEIRARFAAPMDEQLTPFTRWLKGLKGSEYVHPYDDDFAFLQAEGPAREGISETYADLLASQGYKDQAIDMYRRLMERFPEKNRFFAAKIEALQ